MGSIIKLFCVFVAMMVMFTKQSEGAVVNKKLVGHFLDEHVSGVMGIGQDAIEEAQKAADKRKRQEEERSSVTSSDSGATQWHGPTGTMH